MEKLNATDIKKIFTSIKEIIVENKEYLIDLDAAVGDGDLGLTMSEGFTKIVEGIADIKEEDIGELNIKAGMIMANAVPSTMGTLVATAIMRAGKAVKGSKEIELKEFVEMGYAAIEGIMQRGKAQRGEKTILDSLFPAVEALEVACKGGIPLTEAIISAADAAIIATEETKKMVAVHGRAARYGEKSIGHQDPGATVGMFIVQGIRNYITLK